MQLTAMRMREPKGVILLGSLLLFIPIGLLTSHTWLLIVPGAAFVILLFGLILRIANSPKNSQGVEMRLSVQDDGLHYSGANRSGMVRWAGFREVYLLRDMWAAFFKQSDAVSFFPTDQLDRETLDFMLAKLRENHVKVRGENA